MPEIITCTDCGQETFAGLDECHSCKSKIISEKQEAPQKSKPENKPNSKIEKSREKYKFTNLLETITFKKLLYHFILIILGVIFSIGLIEIGYRSYVFFWNPPYVFKPYLAIPNPGGSGFRNGKHITFDKNGFRNPHLEKIKPNDRNILVVGDSVAFGTAVNDNETIQYHLQRLYKKSNINFINVSRPGWYTKQLRMLLINYLSNADHPIHGIIWLYNINDAKFNKGYGAVLKGERFNIMAEMVNKRQGRTALGELAYETWPYLKSLSYISFKLDKLVALSNKDTPGSSNSWKEYYDQCINSFSPNNPKAELEKTYIYEILSIARQYNISIQFVITPYLDQFKDNRILPQEFLQNVLKYKAPLLDIFPYLLQEKDVTQFYPSGDYGHFTNEGNMYIAQKIKENLKPEKYLQ